MTSHCQRLQPDHHIKSYVYPKGVFGDDFCPVTNESFVDVANYSEVKDANTSIFECDAYIGSHSRDISTIASSSSSPSLQ